MKRVYLGNKELTTIATVTNAGGGGGDDTQKWVDYFNGTLTEFTVPEGVTKINNATFNTFTGLTSLTLPSSIASIDNIRMSGMGGRINPFGTLKTMTVKATTPPNIGNDRWSIPFPTTIETIYVPKYSANVYKAIDNWDTFADKIHTLPQNETVVTYNDGTTKKFDIKGELTKDNIENITAATKVEIGDDVTSIGTYTFQNCSNLKSITIPDTLTSIADRTFENCSSLTSIHIPSSITRIGKYAFNECSDLTSVIIENSTSKISYETNAFHGIASNARLFVPSNLVSDYKANSTWNYIFKGGIYAVENSMRVTYTDGTEKTFTGLSAIKSDTDSNKKNAKTVVIYDTVLLINKGAFQDCSGMTSVEIPDSVTHIGSQAFYKCSGLTSVEIPGNVKNLGFMAFDSCSSLTSVTLSEGIETIGAQAFTNCSNIASIEIPASVTNISSSAFLYSSALTSVTIKNSTNKLTYSSQAFYVSDKDPSKKLYVPSNLLADYQADSAWTDAFKGGIFAIQ